MNFENSNASVNGPSCSYANLGNYNGTSKRAMGHPQVAPTTVAGSYIVPDYGAIGYNALTLGGPSCAGYPDIQKAYGAGASNCNTKYMNRLCNQ
jgi:hypothetical protein